MCSICGSLICDTWCPNHRDEGIYTCACCDDGICDGESYYEINGKHYHKECLTENYCTSEILDMFGAKVEIARK